MRATNKASKFARAQARGRVTGGSLAKAKAPIP